MYITLDSTYLFLALKNKILFIKISYLYPLEGLAIEISKTNI